jgi:hypothetical protein
VDRDHACGLEGYVFEHGDQIARWRVMPVLFVERMVLIAFYTPLPRRLASSASRRLT